MQSVVQTIIDASDKIVEDNENFDDIYDALVLKGQSPTKADRTTYAPCISNLNRAGSFQNKSVTPGVNQQVITADNNYLALAQVTVAGSEFLLPENIKAGVTIFGVTGTYTGEVEPEEEE